MLTASQCEYVAVITDGEIICRACAVARVGALTVQRLEHGLSTGLDWSPLIRYSVDEMAGERGYDYAYSETDCDGESAYCDHENGYCEQLAREYCGDCGGEL